jgi:hypothetical protein
MLSILRPKTEEMTKVWVELNDEELCDLFSSPIVTTDIKLQRIREVLHVACMRHATNVQKISDEKVREEKTYGDSSSLEENVKTFREYLRLNLFLG